MKFATIRGTRDILGTALQKMRFIEETSRFIFDLFGYEEIRTPVFEQTDLFTRSIGESTDIVEKEMYTFFDKKGRSLTLRPEGTAPVVRAYLQEHLNKKQPVTRLGYIGPMFRYERPQAGRFREFWQIGAELFGASSPAADAEIIQMNLMILQRAKITDISLHINSIGCSTCRKPFIQALVSYAESQISSLCENCRKRTHTNPLRMLDCKNKDCKQILSRAPKITAYLDDVCRSNLNEVIALLEHSGIHHKEITLDPGIVRGLDYYTGVVFEFKSGGLGAQDAVSAGGRYNRLVEDLGGPSIPAVGFALGIDRLISLLPEKPVPLTKKHKIFIAVLDKDARATATHAAYTLRSQGFPVELEMLERNIKSQLSHAADKNFTHAIIIGEDERKQGFFTLKDLSAKTQTRISSIDALIAGLKNKEKNKGT